MRCCRILIPAAVFSLLSAALASAQSSAGIEGRLVVGITLQGGIFGDDSPRSSQRVGLTMGGQVRWKPDEPWGLVLDIALQPTATKNPHFDERLHVLSIHVAPEIGRTLYLRTGGGVALHFWSGQSAETALSIAPTVGVAMGARRTLTSGVRIGPELVSRASVEHGALAWTFGAQMPISWGAR